MSDQFAKDAISDGVRGHGENLFLGILAGIVAAVVAAGLWVVITVAAASSVGIIPIGLIAIGVGALVGFAIRIAGNGRSMVFGIAGALLSFLGCLGGEILTIVQNSTGPDNDFFAALKTVDLTRMVPIIFARMDVITYVAFAIAVYEGYKLSVRK